MLRKIWGLTWKAIDETDVIDGKMGRDSAEVIHFQNWNIVFNQMSNILVKLH